MKKFFYLFLTLPLVTHAALTQFNWEGTAFFDENSVQLSNQSPLVGYTALTVFSDLSSFVVGNQIDITDITGASFYTDTAVINVAPIGGPFTGDWETPTTPTSALFEDAGAAAGQTAYLLVHQGNGTINVGDYIGLATLGGYTINELDPDGPGGSPPSSFQTFSGGVVTTNIQVIPEPSTFALLAMAGLGLIAARKLRK